MLAINVYARRFVDPREPIFWTYQVLALCLLLVAITGRALVGYRPNENSFNRLALPSYAHLALISAAATIPYLHTLNIGFLSDDYGLAFAAAHADNLLAAMSSRGFVTFFRPLTLFVWWLGGQLWQASPLGYHIFSLFLHTLNALLIYALGRRLLGNDYAALIAALIFAVHPIHVEAVTWPAASADLLCAVFSLTSLLLLELSISTPQSQRRPRLALPGALLSFLLALLSKEAALALPGFVVLRAWIYDGAKDSRRTLLLGSSYAVVLFAFLAWRAVALGGVGGYQMPLSFWNTYFPSAPMLMLGDFLFPVHKVLFATYLGASGWTIMLILMASAALWLMLGLPRVPADRLWLWLSFFLITSVPVWLFLSQPSAALEWSRFAYLPTIGLAFLCGDICAGRGSGFRSRVISFAIIIGFLILTIWYINPWRQAGRLNSQVLRAGISLVNELTIDNQLPTLYVSELPEGYLGAPVFANCYPQALILALGRPLNVRLVSACGDLDTLHPETMEHWALGPDEYYLQWETQTNNFKIVRTGGEKP